MVELVINLVQGFAPLLVWFVDGIFNACNNSYEFDQTWLIYVTGVIGGFNIGGIFAVDRLFMTRLSPEKHLGNLRSVFTVGRFNNCVPLL